VSVDDDLADWIEEQADERGVSKAKIIRDSLETARVTGLVQAGADERAEGAELLTRLERLEARVGALERGGEQTRGGTADGTGDIVSVFAAQLDDRPPRTDHGEQAVIRVFEILLKDGPLRTSELKERLYPEFDSEFATADSMWQSIQRYFDDISGLEKTGRGEWTAAPDQLV
jgi:hypothetical protein